MAEAVNPADEDVPGPEPVHGALEPIVRPLPERPAAAELTSYDALALPETSAEPYARRFSLAYGLLALVAVFAVTAFMLIVTGASPTASTPWSNWKPGGSQQDKLGEIGDHVSQAYLLDDGTRMVVAQPTAPFDLIAVRVTAPDGTAGYVRVDGKAASYSLCGGGDSCAIANGTSSQARALLLSRQALELSLYTFKYSQGVKVVVVFMPPPQGEKATTALLFQRHDFGPELDRPLQHTLGAAVPTPSRFMGTTEGQLVRGLVGARQYSFDYTDLPGSGRVLVLGPTAVTG